MTKLDEAIREYVGNSRSKSQDFKAALKEVHRLRESAAVENNVALRDVFSFFGNAGANFAAVVRQLRAGKDADSVGNVKFDEMVEYACRNYRHLMPACGGESDTGSDEGAFCEWVTIGFRPVLAITSPEILEEAASLLGREFFEDCGDDQTEGSAGKQPRAEQSRVNIKVWRAQVDKIKSAGEGERCRMVKQISMYFKRLPIALQEVIKSEVDIEPLLV